MCQRPTSDEAPAYQYLEELLARLPVRSHCRERRLLLLLRRLVEGDAFAGLTGWQGEVFDVHDYFGARWGSGLTIDPASPDSGETLQSYFEFTITPDIPPYLGTTLSQVRFVRTFTDVLAPLGIPVLVGESSSGAGTRTRTSRPWLGP